MDRYNHFAEIGVDEDFGRGNLSNQWYSEPARPGVKNNTLAPFRTRVRTTRWCSVPRRLTQRAGQRSTPPAACSD